MPGKTKEQLQEEFDEGVRRLWVFFKREGYSQVKRAHKEEDGYFLGRFVKNTLSKYQNGYLSEENIKKIEAFPDWEWNPKDKRQSKKLNILVEALKAYYEEHDHLWVNPELEVEGENIMNAMQYYRARYHTRNPSQKEINALESIPGWTWETPTTSYGMEIKWEQKYQLLLKFTLQFGHTKVPQLYKVGEHALGLWADRQRSLYSEGKLLSHRKERLEKIALWVWVKDSSDDLFNDGLRCLLEFFQEFGHRMPPKNKRTTYGASLHEWILTQRKSYRLRKMPKSRIRKLESIPGWAWSSQEQNWMKHFKSLQEFNDRFDHCEVPFTYKSRGIVLRKWLNKVRRSYVKNELLPNQRKVLEKLKGWNSFLKKSLEYLSTLPLSPAEESIFKELEKDSKQSLKSLSEKSGYAVSTCSKYRKLYRSRKF